MNNTIKISELEETTQVSDNDLLVIVDVANNETKKVQAQYVGTGQGGAEIPISDTAPLDPEEDDLWIDTSEPEEIQEAIKNEYSESTTDTYSCNYENGKTGIVVYDRTGNEAPNYNMSDGIEGTQSLLVDLSPYKRIKVLGFVNVRRHQFSLIIDLTDSLNIYQDNNEYWGRALTIDTSFVVGEFVPNLFNIECHVSQNKQTFTVENMTFITLDNPTVIEYRNLRNDYVVTKIIGYK